MKTMSQQLKGTRRSLAAGELRRLIGFYGVIALLHVIGWGTLVLVVAPKYPAALGIGVGFTAYLLGLQHAFDADHIAAIDNSTRKMMGEGKRPLGVGFFFSLGHSTVVLVLALGIAFAAQAVASQVTGDNAPFRSVGGLLGTGVSGFFLLFIALLNIMNLLDVLQTFTKMRQGKNEEPRSDAHSDGHGFMNRLLGRLSQTVSYSWQMFPIGFLFGLGFDTASEVMLLALAAGAASSGLPFYAITCLPVIFAAGMCVMDTADGAFMSKAYGWAFSNPIRKIYYNITVTGLSVLVAVLVGSIELLSIVQNRFNLSGPFWNLIAGLDLGRVGYFIVGLFIVAWGLSLAIWKLGHIEERWRQPQLERLNYGLGGDERMEDGKRAVLLVGHGSRADGANDGIYQLADFIKQEAGYEIVELGFLGISSPSIEESIAACVAQGATKVVVIPYFLHMGVHIQNDLPGKIDDLRALYPGVDLMLGKHLGFHRKLAEIVIERIEETAGVTGRQQFLRRTPRAARGEAI